ncbi:hypothetical protein, partial [Nostoc sp.]|uniref:hypothetical protein n=1 Tax=Nostoc sp. TaxID=1180 RepID=UPI002FF99361
MKKEIQIVKKRSGLSLTPYSPSLKGLPGNKIYSFENDNHYRGRRAGLPTATPATPNKQEKSP